MAIEQLSDKKLSNVIGAPFNPIVLRQLGIRVANNSTLSKTQDQVLFMANKMAWARLTSSVNVVFPPSQLSGGNLLTSLGDAAKNLSSFYSSLNLDPNNYKTPDALAKSWILEAGTSFQVGNQNGINLRQGIGPDGAYGLGGTEELGYRPMPGLTSIQVQTMGTLGSLRQATISFNVWNMDQLNIIEALYFRLGYSMLLEWGHVQYFSNDGNFVRDGVFGITNPFAANKRKEQVQQEIARKVRTTNGNYDGMLGIVSNFNWSFNQSGGYDCTIRLIGLGAIMDSLRIDQSYALPPGLVKRFKKDIDLIGEREAEEERRRVSTTDSGAPTFTLEREPINLNEAYEIVKKYNGFKGTFGQFLSDYSVWRTTSANPGKEVTNQASFITIDTSVNPPGIDPAQQVAAKEKFDGLWTFYSDTILRLQPEYVVDVDLQLVNKYIGEFLNQNASVDETVSNNNTFVYADPLLRWIQQGSDYYDATRGRAVVSIDSPQINDYDDDGNEANETTIDNPAQLTLKSPGGTDVDFNFDLSISYLQNKDYINYPFTRRQILKTVFEAYRKTFVKAKITKVEKDGKSANIEIIFTLTAEIPKSESADKTLPDSKTLGLGFVIKTNNPLFIQRSSSQFTPSPSSPTKSPASSGDTSGTVNQESTEQVDAAKGFQSALHAMLTVIKARLQADSSTKGKNIAAADILEITQQFYSSGILKNILTLDTAKKAVNIAQAPKVGEQGVLEFDVTKYALKGFNSELMINPAKYDQVPNVDFKKLCTAFIIRYPKAAGDGTESTVQVPVYISLGYLLAFLNNMCLIYDSTTKLNPNQPQNGEQRPYFYIDFNPETNFCLTSPQQFSIDPTVCMIPLEATPEEYQAIFPDNVKVLNKSSVATIFNDKERSPIFDPSKENGISAELTKNGVEYRAERYQGKIMNILLNIDYLLNTASSFQASDAEHAVNLQPYLERIMTDINKSTGNMNLFRVGYRDESNTIQILDSQWVPKLGEENTILRKGTLDPDTRAISGIIPVFDSGSLAREFQLKTTLSTKLASVIAISAQAATGSVNSKDHSSFSWLNQNFQDRYKQYIQDPSNGASGASNGATKDKEDSNEVKAAVLFNSHVKSVYDANSIAAIGEKIELSKNYYIERISKVKSSDPVTVSAPFIPADLDITIDGISGIIMGNAFLIPEERLPLSLRGVNGIPKVGFVVTNLTNTIENNQWLTKFKGQMIKLRDYDEFKKLAQIAGTVGRPRTIPPGGAGSSNTAGGFGPYPGAGPEYSGARQVLAPESVNSQNFSTKYYPGYVFQKGKSDIDLAAFGLSPLAEAEIIDDTTMNRFNIGRLKTPVPYFIIHHTAGSRPNAKDTYGTFYERGYPAQYFITPSGQIHRFMPDGALAWHAGGVWNSLSIGVELAGRNDGAIQPAQTDAAIRLAHYLGFKIANIIGHGKVRGSKEDDEGYSTVRRLNPKYVPKFDPNFGRF